MRAKHRSHAIAFSLCCARRVRQVKLPRAARDTEKNSEVDAEEGLDSETEPEDDTFSRPEPAQVIKLSAQPRGNGGRVQWLGRLRGGGKDVLVDPGLTEGPLADKPIIRPAEPMHLH